MPSIGNFSVWIEVNGKRLPEYGIQLSANEATCWIPSEAGKNFQILYSDSIRATGTSIKADIDGIRVPNGKMLHPRGHNGQTNQTVRIRGMNTSGTTIRPFVFSHCELLEEEGFAANHQPNLGTIKCEIDEIQVHSGHYRSHRRTVDLPPLRVHERAKKGIVHGVQLGNDIVCEMKHYRRITTLRRVVTVKFEYRPIAVLMADGIVASQVPKIRNLQTSESDIIDLTLDDDTGSEDMAGNKSRNSERSRSNRDINVQFKKEPKKERPITWNTDIIDLTI